MSKRRIIIILTAIILIVVGIISYLVKNNYNYGLQLYSAAGSMSVQTQSLADSIEYLDKIVNYSTIKADDINTNAFYSAVASMRSNFGYDDMPLSDNVRINWINRIETLYKQTRNDTDLLATFKDEVKRGEMRFLHHQLTDFSIKLKYLRERYNFMTNFERCMFNWRKEQKILSKSVDIL